MTRFTRDLDLFAGICLVLVLGYVLGQAVVRLLIALLVWLGDR